MSVSVLPLTILDYDAISALWNSAYAATIKTTGKVKAEN